MTPPLPASISLETKSTELPIAWDVMPAGDAQSEATSRSPLVLSPGKPSELLLRSRNNSHQSMRISLAIKGDFHASWLVAISGDATQVAWSQSVAGEFTEIIWHEPIPPKSAISHVLSFQIPDHFFEHPYSLVHEDALRLHYQSELQLYAALPDEQTRRLAGHQVVNIYVRPDSLYTDFLPEIYQQSDFVGRFLSIFEQAFEPTVQILDDFWAYLDPLTAPKALIPFLAEWVAWPLNPKWTLRQQRWLIRHAIELYQWRGTRYGLQFALSLVTGLPNDDNHISIRENHQADFVIGDVSLQDEPTLGGGKAFYFTVELMSDTAVMAAQLRENEATIRAVIEQEKPAFCTYDLAFLDAYPPTSEHTQ